MRVMIFNSRRDNYSTMTIMTNQQKLDALASGKRSGWLEEAVYRKENRVWLRRSQKIALKVLRTLREQEISQKELAVRIGVSPQQISKIVKGRENLTLESISKIEGALGIVLMEIPELSLSMQLKFSAIASDGFRYSVSERSRFVHKYPEPYGSGAPWHEEIGNDTIVAA